MTQRAKPLVAVCGIAAAAAVGVFLQVTALARGQAGGRDFDAPLPPPEAGTHADPSDR